MPTGLFIGRFQPFHNAHLIDIKNALKEVDNFLIVIGSAQYSYTSENPFTSEEREDMINKILNKERIRNCRIFALKDINDDSKWVDYVKKQIPEFDIVFSGNMRVIRLFKEKNVPVRKIRLIKNISGTLIREKIIKGEKWRDDVPVTVASYLEKIDGIKRIKAINL